MNDGELFDKQLREHWGAPRPPSPALRARLLSAITTPASVRRRWVALAAVAAVVMAVVTAGITHRSPTVSDEDLAWFADNDEDTADVTAYFDLAAVDDDAD